MALPTLTGEEPFNLNNILGQNEMTETAIISLLVLILITISVCTFLFVRMPSKQKTDDQSSIADILRSEFRNFRQDSADEFRRIREEVSISQQTSSDTLVKTLLALGQTQKDTLKLFETRIKHAGDTSESSLNNLRMSIDLQLKTLRESNDRKLEQIRTTVDEKLQTTLEKRLGESFKLVSARLEAVQHGLGDMQKLAAGVGDLKRVLTNVKTRGTWGEYQIGDILEQILSPGQYEKNVQPRPSSSETVEYAICLPGQESSSQLWLPIDSKFPQEDYQRLVDASEDADAQSVEVSTASLIRSIRASAKEISLKYIEPPYTTDFAIMFLPTEGLYSEVLRQPGLVDELQQKYRVVIAGPTTLSAILSSLRMGFRTLAIEKRSSEVWNILSAVKTEFGKFGDVLNKVKRQLDAASNTIESTEVRTRVMGRKLKSVESLPSEQLMEVLGLESLSGNAIAEKDPHTDTQSEK